MGLHYSHLTEPITDKVSSDETSEKLNVGTSSMQGWRENQEDAHNSILNYDENTSFFAVYDGHGGHEVAVYTSQKFPEFLKQSEAYKEGNIEKALTEAFLNFDATLVSPKVITELKKIAAEREAEEDDEDEEEENVLNLYEEASMPIEQVMVKYTSKMLKTPIKYKNKKVENDQACSSQNIPSGPSKSGDEISNKCEAGDTKDSVNTDPEVTKSKDNKEDNSDAFQQEKEIANLEDVKVKPIQNGDISPNDDKKEVKSETENSPSHQENGFFSKKGKGKAIVKKTSPEPKNPTRPKRSASNLYSSILNETFSSESDDDDDDEIDETFVEPQVSSDDDDDNEGVNAMIETEDDSSEDVEDEEEDDNDDDDDEEELEKEDEESMEFQRNLDDEPGSGSGCTAVVALLRDNKLYVANAGDSRCVVCRNGKAMEMSFDHKPEDLPEAKRIVKAGGKVTADGRVNGGLNLSRAIGDHAYKQNKVLSDREQMITALPDIQTLEINPTEDTFMVLACDGIWNSMSSQEVVDFVKCRIEKGITNMSKICEEMFDFCLASSTSTDGTGCDNMTAVIVQFRTNRNKRERSVDDTQQPESNKIAKTDVPEESVVSS